MSEVSPQTDPLEIDISHNATDDSECEVSTGNSDTGLVGDSVLGNQGLLEHFSIDGMLQLFSQLHPDYPKYNFLYLVCPVSLVVKGQVLDFVNRWSKPDFDLQGGLFPQNCNHPIHGIFEKRGDRFFRKITGQRFQRRCLRKKLLGFDRREWTLGRLVWAAWADKYLAASRKVQNGSRSSRNRTTRDVSHQLGDRGVSVDAGISSVHSEREEASVLVGGTIPQVTEHNGDRVQVVDVGRVEALERRVEQLETGLAVVMQIHAMSRHFRL